MLREMKTEGVENKSLLLINLSMRLDLGNAGGPLKPQ